jgi:ABC-type sugar transport system ATPase subunit
MEPILQIQAVSKAFGHVQALSGIQLQVVPGQVLGLLGDNGAGKSTLVKILSGVYTADSGKLRIKNQEVVIGGPAHAQALGIATVYQDLSLVDTRPVAHNIYLGREPRVLGLILNKGKMEREAVALLAQLKIKLPSVSVDVEMLSGGQRQAVAIARAIAQGGDILLLDEPWASLGVEQTHQVQELMLDLRKHGKAIVLITHDLSNITAITDRIAVLRHGKVVAHVSSQTTDQHEVISWITGAAPGRFQEEAIAA